MFDAENDAENLPQEEEAPHSWGDGEEVPLHLDSIASTQVSIVGGAHSGTRSEVKCGLLAPPHPTPSLLTYLLLSGVDDGAA